VCVALYALEATIRVRGPAGEREIPVGDLHLLPGDHPDQEFSLRPGELITAVRVPLDALAARSRYVKVRDRQAYAFALASCAAAVQVQGGMVRAARFALGGVGTKPWRVPEAERSMEGRAPTRGTFAAAAEIALRGAKPRRDNAFKVELAKRTAVRALMLSAEVS
jgi:xanthine dehydrogenase YagS FAD-binding subunit